MCPGHISSAVPIDKCILILQSNRNYVWGYPANSVFPLFFFHLTFSNISSNATCI